MKPRKAEVNIREAPQPSTRERATPIQAAVHSMSQNHAHCRVLTRDYQSVAHHNDGRERQWTGVEAQGDTSSHHLVAKLSPS